MIEYKKVSDTAVKIKVLVIEDDELFRETIVELLRDEGYEVEGVRNGEEAIKLAEEYFFNLIISDVRLPGGMDGLETLRRIKEASCYPFKMIVITGYADRDAPVRAIRMGVDDYIYKPFQTEEFLHAVKQAVKTFQLERNVGYYRELSLHDDLTGLYNRRYFYEVIQKEVDRAFRYNHCVSLLIVDIDNFKAINDSYGHLAGDMVLRQIAQLFIVSLRKVDYIFRYGGEEFAILLPETKRENAFSVAERLRTVIKSNNFVVKSSDKVNLTVSIGLASCPRDAKDKKEIVHKADKALYRAKQLGKDKVCGIEDMLGE